MKLGITAHSLGVGREPEALFEAAAGEGLRYLSIGVDGWRTPGTIEKVAMLRARYGIELETHWGDDFVRNGATQPVDEFAAFVEKACLPLGIRVIGVCSSHHRWRKDPPLAEQMDQLARALDRLAPVAEQAGVVLVVENHADYRGYEVVKLLDRVNSPAVRARLDTANAYAVIEEPVAAAEAMAPYVAATHIKDVMVRPVSNGFLLTLVGCGLGEGDVDLATCVRLLAEKAPDPSTLSLTLEIEPPRGTDLKGLTAQSVAYARQLFAPYLDSEHGHTARRDRR
jgi:sugar phosphate isomerase/epimerase